MPPQTVGIQINECSTKLSIKQNFNIVNDKLLMYNVGCDFSVKMLHKSK